MNKLDKIIHKIRVFLCSHKNIMRCTFGLTQWHEGFVCNKFKSVVCGSKRKVRAEYCSSCNPKIAAQKYNPGG